MKKTLKRITVLALALAMIMSFAGCGETEKAEAAVTTVLESFKMGDLDNAEEYMNVEDMTGDGDEGIGLDGEEMLKAMFQNLDYKIISSELMDDGSVIVKTEITATDMAPVLSDFMASAIEYAFATAFVTPQPTDEELEKIMEDMFTECATKPDLATVTNTVDITVTETAEGWRLADDELFVDAVTGGLLTAADEMEAAFSEWE